MTSLGAILAAADPIEGGFTTNIPDGWLQGRTAYGGLSSALALHAAQALEPDLPPLRSAQVAFIGPLAGNVRVTATKLRRGRNAAFIQSDVVSEAGLGFRATFCFMATMTSAITHDTAERAPRPAPEPDSKVYIGPPEFFTSNFEFLDIKDDIGATDWLRWARLRDREGLDPTTELLTIADGLPPAAMKLFEKRAPLSSLTWIVNLLTPAPQTRDGWWLLSASTDYVQGGFSTQRMRMWNADGALVAEGMQGVAIFA